MDAAVFCKLCVVHVPFVFFFFFWRAVLCPRKKEGNPPRGSASLH